MKVLSLPVLAAGLFAAVTVSLAQPAPPMSEDQAPVPPPSGSQPPPPPPGSQPPPPLPRPSPSEDQKSGGRGKPEGLGKRGMDLLERMKQLPEETQAKIKAARDKAMQDPEIKALEAKMQSTREEFGRAMWEAIKKADPSLEETLKDSAIGKRLEKKRGPGSPGGPGMGQLTDAERERVMTARKAAEKDPAVVAAKQKQAAAGSPAERRTADKDFREAMKGAMLKADPSLAPVLEKLHGSEEPPQA